MNTEMSTNYNILRINENELIVNGVNVKKGKDSIYRVVDKNKTLNSSEWDYLLQYLKAEIQIQNERAQREVDNLLKEMGIQKFCKN